MKKNILLIGGSQGIGLEIARQLHERHHLFIASRSDGGLRFLNVKHLPFDATKDKLDLSALPDTLDGFVYCPGSINLKPFKMMETSTFRDEMELNFFGLVRVVSDIQGRMSEGSNMIFFSSVAVHTGLPFHTSIAAAKGAVEGYAKALAAEYAPKIRVNVIAPSLVDTPLASHLLNNEKKREKMAERHPLKRIGQAKDIAGLSVYLLESESSWITGQVFGINGGMGTLNIT